MNEPRQPADLSGRRRRLGASRETMAAGLGLHVDDVKAIEDGGASEARCAEYDGWLRRIESWPADVRTRQLLAAGRGRRFEADG
jgi:hypothetical protein